MSQDHAVSLRRLRREFRSGDARVVAVDDVTLAVDFGEMVAVMGPSGSGKSTLLALCGGLDAPTDGEIWIESTAVHEMSLPQLAKMRRDHVGFVFQDFNLVSGLTALENVMLPLELAGTTARRARREALRILAGMDIANLGGRFPDQMSGGQQQRVAIARALIGNRRVLLADEPTGSLDTVTGELVLAALRKYVGDGAACILVTHSSQIAGRADRVVHLVDGRIVGGGA